MTLNFFSKTTATLARAALAGMAGILLASCGGGTTQVEPFVPTRYIAFGDELSAFEPDGRKYMVNAFNAAATAYECTLNPLWIQTVASIYGFQFAECPVGTVGAKAVSRAARNARAAELKLQIDAQAQQGFTATDLVTVLVGTNDVKEIYEARGSSTEDELLALARERGVAIATQVNRLVDLGAKVIISTTPDVGLTPYAVSKGATDAALLSRLSAAMNGRIRVNILNDGRFVGLVLADELVQTAVRFPSAYGLADGAGVTTAACSVALPDCDSTKLVAGANVDGWLWADELRLGVVAHRQLGSLAAARAQNNPF
jgi:outer membrane lipase/esterase